MNHTICCSIDETEKYYVQWSKPGENTEWYDSYMIFTIINKKMGGGMPNSPLTPNGGKEKR